MPTYEYRCPEGHEFEVFQKMSEPPVADCPSCGAEAERLMSTGAGLLFKGPGFYITDYRSDAYREQAKKEKSAFSGSDGAGKKSGEGKGTAGAEAGSSGEKKKAATAKETGSNGEGASSSASD